MMSDSRTIGFSRMFTAAFLFGAAMTGPWGGMISAQAADSAVVVMYHRFGESDFPATNIRVDQFEAHIR